MAHPESPLRVGLAAKIETVPGTSAAPTLADDAVRVIGDPRVEEFYQSENLRDDVRYGGIDALAPEIPVGRAFRMRFRTALLGAGAAYSALVLPEVHALLLAAGFAATVDTTPSAETVTYDLSDDPISAATIMLQLGGHEYLMTYGVIESLIIGCDQAGAFPYADWVAVGIAAAPSDQALESATYANTAYPIWRGAGSLAIAGVAGIAGVRRMSLDLGIQLATRMDANVSDVFAGSKITRRLPELRIGCEVSLLANFNPLADKLARTQRAIDIGFGQLNAQYEKVAVDVDDARVLQAEGPQDDNGLLIWDTQYRVSRPAAGSTCSLIFS